MAPSAFNAQPWYFLIIKNRNTIEKMRKIVLKSANRHPSLPPKTIRQYKTFFNAPYIISVCLDTSKRWYLDPAAIHPQTLEDAMDNPDYFSVATAAQNIMLAAHSMGLGACWVAPHSIFRSKLEKLLDIRPPFKLITNITIGYYNKKSGKPMRKKLKAIHRFAR